MDDGESHDREAGAAVGGQPTDGDPAATPRPGDGHGRKTRAATAKAEAVKS